MKAVLHIQEGGTTPWNGHQKAFEISVANFALFLSAFLSSRDPTRPALAAANPRLYSSSRNSGRPRREW